MCHGHDGAADALADQLRAPLQPVGAALLGGWQDIDGEGVGGDVLQRSEAVVDEEHPAQQAQVFGEVAEQEDADQRDRHEELGGDDPEPAAAHRADRHGVDEGSPDELEGPGEQHDGGQLAGVAVAHAAIGEIADQGDRHEAPGDALGEVHRAEHPDALAAVVDEGHDYGGLPNPSFAGGRSEAIR